MLVEDDNNLREIYEARLVAEGYSIVSAEDGEAALALAAKERPDLVITDVMMPKISGFEMLDILRNTPALRDVKVIMLTALGQAEDNARANSLGADRYLVKSQVTLEDIVKATHDVFDESQADGVVPGQETPESDAAIAAPDIQAWQSMAVAPESPVASTIDVVDAPALADAPDVITPIQPEQIITDVAEPALDSPEIPATDVPTLEQAVEAAAVAEASPATQLDLPDATLPPVSGDAPVDPAFVEPAPQEVAGPSIDDTVAATTSDYSDDDGHSSGNTSIRRCITVHYRRMPPSVDTPSDDLPIA